MCPVLLVAGAWCGVQFVVMVIYLTNKTSTV